MTSLHSPPKSTAVSMLPEGLPDPLIFPNGTVVASSQEWQKKRRPEILRAFETQIYGRAPHVRPERLHFRTTAVTPDALHGAATRHDVILTTTADSDRTHVVQFILLIPVFRLLNREGVGQAKMPASETPLQTGSIAYHLRTGKHDLTLYD